MPALVLVGAGDRRVTSTQSRASVLNPGPHGLSEVLYAYTSAANNNGSAFAGFGANTDYQNIALGLAMLLGRFVPIVLVLGLAGSLARQRPVPATAGTLPTTGPLFVGLLVGVVVIVAGLTFLPALALSPSRRACNEHPDHPRALPTPRPGTRVASGLLDPKMQLASLPEALRKLDPRTRCAPR